MYEYIPKKENNKPTHLIFILLLGGFLLLALTTALGEISFRWAFQLVGIVCITLAVFLYTRYFTRFFCYAVVPREDGSCDLTVTECQRKSRITVCRLSLSGIERIEVVPLADRARHKALKKQSRADGRKLFSYTVNLAPSSLCYLFATECGEAVTIVFEPDAHMLEMLGYEGEI